MSGTDPDPRPDRPIDRTQAYRPEDAAPQPQPDNLPKIQGITLHYELARGGMGVVYSGRQDFLDRRVAVKLLSVELGGESFVQRFQREAKILAGIKHPNIVACHMAGQTDDGQSYLVMEYIDGPSLKKWIADHGPVPIKAALRTARAVGQALGHAFTMGIIHRDVKPENILLETVTSTALDVAFPFTPKVVDLGLARASDGNAALGLTSPGSVMGTPATMSPEQYDEPDAVDFRTDIYGLGCALYEMLVGKPAFRGKRLSDIVAKKREPVAPDPRRENAEVPAAVAALVQSMLATDREDRPRSYRDLDEQLVALLGAIASSPTRPPTGQRVVGEETELTVMRRPTARPEEPAPPASKTAAKPPAPPAPPANDEGPGLLKTAELNFLAEGLGDGAAAAAEPAFRTRPPAGGSAPPIPEWSTRPPAPPEPVGGSTHTSAPPAAPAPLVVSGGNGRKVAIAIAAAAAAGIGLWFGLGGSREPDVGGNGAVSGNPGNGAPPPAKPNRPPDIKSIVGPTSVAMDKQFEVAVDASDGDSDRLTYSWTVPDDLVGILGSSVRKDLSLRVYEGLPGVEFDVQVDVSDGTDKVTRTHRVTIGECPERKPLIGYRDNPDWRLDRRDGSANVGWQAPLFDDDNTVRCSAGTSLREARTALGNEPFWQWSGRLLSETDLVGERETRFATVGLRFEFGNRAWAVLCRREGDGATWSAEIVQLDRDGDGWTAPRVVAEPFRWKEAADAVDEYWATFSVERRRDQLTLCVGEVRIPPDQNAAEVRRTGPIANVTLPATASDAQLTLFVDQGIGRFRVKKR